MKTITLTPRTAPLLLLGFVVSFLSSCVFIELDEPTTNQVVNNLNLDANWRGNLINQTVVEGRVINNHYRNVWGVTLRARVYDKNQLMVEEQEFTIPVTLTREGVATFKEYMNTNYKNVSRIDVRIVDAQD